MVRGVMRMGWLSTSWVLWGAAALGGYACTPAPAAAPPAPGAEAQVTVVHARRLQPQTLPRVERRSARAEPQREVSLAFGVPGRVSQVLVDEGERVNKGALLATVDTRALAAQVTSARAALQQAEREATRAQGLRAKNAVSAQRVDQLDSGVQMARAQLDAAEAQLDQAKIRAPFAADVVRRMAEPGAWANPGVPMLHLATLDPIRVVALVPDQVRPQLQPGAAAEVSARGLATSRQGHVVQVSPVADARTGLFRVEIDVPNPDRRLAAGQPVEVAIAAGEMTDVCVLEPEWLVYRYDGPAIMVVQGGKARTIPLADKATEVDGRFVVSKDNLPELPVIVRGQSLAREGGAVRTLAAPETTVAEDRGE